ncbi:hypothetical protein J5N97_029871 [Dioscorea zingiberensis]|uniref:MSP domain-containing protein n=1 Tax=Dioscorea zingiberensis TaxID=325984 RepID=A0A9D5H3L0_9LILI|nr:hypothetical protein J5N97_029871 [Dioscorea zingiberensis]
MSGGDLLSVQPTELKFPFELRKQSSCSMQLTNKTDQYVAFKVKTTNPRKYCVRPNTGVVLPGTTCDVTVTMQAQKEAPPDMQCKDKFLLQSVVAEHGVTTKDITAEMFNKEPGKVVEEIKLRVVYIRLIHPLLFLKNQRRDHPKVAQSFEEQQRERPTEASSVISKLTQEKNRAMQQNQKLMQELEVLKRESGRHHGGFSVMFVVLVGILGIIIGYIIKKT